MTTDSTTTPKIQDQREKPLLKKWKFMAALMADPELSGPSKSVAFALMDILNNEDGYARPGHPKIAERAGTNVSNVKRGIKDLQRRGWFCVSPVFDGGAQKANRYYPVWKRATTGTPPAESERKRKASRAPVAKAEAKSPDQSNSPAVAPAVAPEYVPTEFVSGVVSFSASNMKYLHQRMGDRLPLFLRMVERDSGSWTKETWANEIAPLYKAAMEPEPF